MTKRILVGLLLLVYIFILCKILVFKEVPIVRMGHLMLNFGGTQTGPANFIPLKSILYYLLGKNGFFIAALNIGGNIILFIPLGFLLPIIFTSLNWRKIIGIAFASGLLVESIQAILEIGIFDIDDVILNGFGLMIGYGCYILFSNFSLHTKKLITLFSIGLSIGIILIYIIAQYEHIELPLRLEPSLKKEAFKLNEEGSMQCCDPCKGTGGTGKIIAINTASITIQGRRNNGSPQIIKLTNATIIKNATGVISLASLKMGDNITVVIDESETASLILLCGLSKPMVKH